MVRLRHSVIAFVLVACILVATVSMVPPLVYLVRNGEADTTERKNTAINTLQSVVTDYFAKAQTLPTQVGAIYSDSVIDFRNQSAVLPLFTTLWRSCTPVCITVYFGLTDDFFLLRGVNNFCRRAASGNGDRECCPTYADTNKTCIGPYALSPKKYFPTQRPWYGTLAPRNGWTSLYVDFTSGAFASTVGGPITAANGSLMGVMVVDLTFGPLVTILANMTLVTNPSAWVLYEAGTNNLIDSSFGMRSTSELFRLQNLNGTIVEHAISTLSAEELAFDGTLSKVSGPPLDREYVTVARVANFTGLNLRMLVVFHDDPTGAVKASLGLSIGLAAAFVMLGCILIVVLAVVLFERPLSGISEALGTTVEASLNHTEESEAKRRITEESNITELSKIIAGINGLSDELVRLRAFVPASCLVANAATMNEIADDGEDHEDQVSEGSVSRMDRGESVVSTSTTRSESTRTSDMTFARLRAAQRATAAASAMPGAASALFTEKSLTCAVVSYLTVQLRELTDAIDILPNVRQAPEILSLFAAVCEGSASRWRGVIDVFCGDRCTIAFNAMKPNTSHRVSSVSCAIMISQLIRTMSIDVNRGIDFVLNRATMEWAGSGNKDQRTDLFPRGVSSGVSVGQALVGNMGSDTVARFSIVGECVRHSAGHEMRCRSDSAARDRLPLQCVCDGSVRHDIAHSVVYQCVDYASGEEQPHGTTSKPTFVLAPSRMLIAPEVMAAAAQLPGTDGEWMYELTRAHDANEFNDINAAFDAFASCQLDAAAERLRIATDRPDAILSEVGIMRMKELLATKESQPNPAVPVA